ncbi:MAG: tagatose 1,6-diphosphate aldolase [Candidatus Solibacter sp.]|nr:tagatose 1,6-diphosphate aldolase [Candidatus Solibacter sp.]
MKLSDGKMKRMKALANERGVIAATAMDQRGNLQKALAIARGVDVHEITPAMMSEFKVAVSRILTPHASAILLDPEFGLEAGRARAPNAGLLLAYELSGYDTTRPGRLPDLLPHVSVKRLVDWGADAVKILIYYSPFDEASVIDVKHAFMERIGAECETYEIPFFLEIVGYDPRGGDEKGLEFARQKPEIVKKGMEVFSRLEYRVDVLKVGSLHALPRGRGRGHQTVHLSLGRREQFPIPRIAGHCQRGGYGLRRRTVRACHLEERHTSVRQARAQSARRVAAVGRRAQHQRGQRCAALRSTLVREAGDFDDGLTIPCAGTGEPGRSLPGRIGTVPASAFPSASRARRCS